MEPNSSRANRLGYILKCRADDPVSVQKLAVILNYYPDGLQKDMIAVYDYITELENKIKRH